jgi:predicted RNase H-like HicB family nuclease
VQIVLGISDGLKETNAELTKQLYKHLDEIVHRVRVEQDKGIYYWFDRDNNTFLAQGKTTEEIITNIKTRLPTHIFYIEESNHIICAKHGWEPQEARKE